MRERRKEDRRKIERRAPKEGVNIRHDDKVENPPRRIRWGQLDAVGPELSGGRGKATTETKQ